MAVVPLFGRAWGGAAPIARARADGRVRPVVEGTLVGAPPAAEVEGDDLAVAACTSLSICIAPGEERKTGLLEEVPGVVLDASVEADKGDNVCARPEPGVRTDINEKRQGVWQSSSAQSSD